MGQHRVRVPLHDFEIAARETGAVFRRGEQCSRLSDQAIGILIRGRRRFVRQRLIDHDDECRKFTEPLEGGFIQHEVEIFTRAGDGSDITFVGGALQFK